MLDRRVQMKVAVRGLIIWT